MKKFIFTLTCAFALLFTSNLSAQLSVGGRVGINLAKQEIDFQGGSVSTDSKVGLDIGVFADIGITENFSVQPGLHFLQKGLKSDDGTSESKGTINYLEIPVHAKYGFGTETIRAFVMAGPSFGFGLGGKSEFCFNGDCQEADLDFDDDGVKRTDFSLSLGAGVGFGVGEGTLFLDLRYLLGIANIDDSGDDDFTISNRGFQIGLGYMFALGN